MEDKVITLTQTETTTEQLCDEWLFMEATYIAEHLVPGSEEHERAVNAWVKRYDTWIKHNESLAEDEIVNLKYENEKKLERTKGLYALAAAIGGALVTGVFYVSWTKIMQVWEDKGHVPLGSALKSMIRTVKPPKV